MVPQGSSLPLAPPGSGVRGWVTLRQLRPLRALSPTWFCAGFPQPMPRGITEGGSGAPRGSSHPTGRVAHPLWWLLGWDVGWPPGRAPRLEPGPRSERSSEWCQVLLLGSASSCVCLRGVCSDTTPSRSHPASVSATGKQEDWDRRVRVYFGPCKGKPKAPKANSRLGFS